MGCKFGSHDCSVQFKDEFIELKVSTVFSDPRIRWSGEGGADQCGNAAVCKIDLAGKPTIGVDVSVSPCDKEQSKVDDVSRSLPKCDPNDFQCPATNLAKLINAKKIATECCYKQGGRCTY